MKNKRIVLLEAAPDKEITIGTDYSNRVSALAPSSVSLLTRLGVWPRIEAGGRAGQVHRSVILASHWSILTILASHWSTRIILSFHWSG